MTARSRRSADEILAHIEQYGIARKDPAPEHGDRTVVRRNKKARSHRMTLDLHGLRSDGAIVKLRSALHRCRENGIQELLIIHGYGLHSNPQEGPVLKKLVRDLLDNDLRPLYRSYRTAITRDGGEGATLVAVR
jgi:DNA-nicking Smr family endonuclease